MRDSQYANLQSMSEQLTDVVLVECDPANWPGGMAPPAKLDRDTAVARYWAKKHASASLAVLQRVLGLVAQIELRAAREVPAEDAPPVDDLDREIATAEREAAKMIERMRQNDEARRGVPRVGRA